MTKKDISYTILICILSATLVFVVLISQPEIRRVDRYIVIEHVSSSKTGFTCVYDLQVYGFMPIYGEERKLRRQLIKEPCAMFGTDEIMLEIK